MNIKRENGVKPPRVRIGLFDSGAGGLSVLRRLVLTGGDLADYIYLADAARCPYGNRPPFEISVFAEQTARWLLESAVDRIVMACNTSASTAGATLRKRIALPIHDLISPVSVQCAGKYKTLAVFATAATCRSGAFSRAIAAVDPDMHVLEIPCPELVPLVESGELTGPLAIEGVKKCLQRLNGEHINGLILGCTHFPFLSDVFASLVPSNVELIDPALYLQSELFSTNDDTIPLVNDKRLYRRCSFFTTGDAEQFARIAERCLGLGEGDLQTQVCSISTADFAGLVPASHVGESRGVVNTLSPVANTGAEVSI